MNVSWKRLLPDLERRSRHFCELSTWRLKNRSSRQSSGKCQETKGNKNLLSSLSIKLQENSQRGGRCSCTATDRSINDSATRCFAPMCFTALPSDRKGKRTNTSSCQMCDFLEEFASPLGCAAVPMALSTAAVSGALLFNHRVQLKWTHTLSRVLTPLCRLSIRGKTRVRKKSRKMRLSIFRPSGRHARPPQHISEENVAGFHYWRPLLCLNHNGGDSACQ